MLLYSARWRDDEDLSGCLAEKAVNRPLSEYITEPTIRRTPSIIPWIGAKRTLRMTRQKLRMQKIIGIKIMGLYGRLSVGSLKRRNRLPEMIRKKNV